MVTHRLTPMSQKTNKKNAPVNNLSELSLEAEVTMHQMQFAAARGTTLFFPGTVTGALQFIIVAIVLTDAAQGMYGPLHMATYMCTIAISQACRMSVISNS